MSSKVVRLEEMARASMLACSSDVIHELASPWTDSGVDLDASFLRTEEERVAADQADALDALLSLDSDDDETDPCMLNSAWYVAYVQRNSDVRHLFLIRTGATTSTCPWTVKVGQGDVDWTKACNNDLATMVNGGEAIRAFLSQLLRDAHVTRDVHIHEYAGESVTVRRPVSVLTRYSRAAARSTAAFWDEAREEFVRRAWAPERLAWCLDIEDARALSFST